ncbi:MAG: hypothetical protein F9K44_12595, partial [Hyphomicrobiaceae bacterium]
MSEAANESDAGKEPAALAVSVPLATPARLGRSSFLVSLIVALAVHGAILAAFVSGHLRLGAAGRMAEAIDVTVVDATILESLSSDPSKAAESRAVPSEDGNAPEDALASRTAPPKKPVEANETKPEEKPQPKEQPAEPPPVPELPKESSSIAEAPPELKRFEPEPPPPALPDPPVVTASLPAPEAAPEQKEPAKPSEQQSPIEPVAHPP